MHADLGEIEQAVEEADVPIGSSPGAYVTQHPGVLAGKVACADGRHGARAHVGGRIEEVEDSHLGGQSLTPVLHEVAHDLDPGEAERLHHAAQNVEMPA